MNVLVVNSSASTSEWVAEGLRSMDDRAEVNFCDSVEFALCVLQVHDEVNLIVVEADLLRGKTVAGIKRLWRLCRGAEIVAIATKPTQEEMVACVNGGALGYIPRSLPCTQLGPALAHVANGSLWLPNLRLTGR